MTRSSFFNRREFHIPQGSVKVADRHSDAVAYISATDAGFPRAVIFYGKQNKPVANFRYSNEAAREKSVREYFEKRQERARYMAERRGSPSDTALRNRKIKRVLEAKFGRGKVRVTGERGTAYGWVRVVIIGDRPQGQEYRDARGEVIRLIQEAGITLGYYDSADYGAGHEIAIDWSRS
jgi:hypothetical protein